jgi:hypothetical protein
MTLDNLVALVSRVKMPAGCSVVASEYESSGITMLKITVSGAGKRRSYAWRAFGKDRSEDVPMIVLQLVPELT